MKKWEFKNESEWTDEYDEDEDSRQKFLYVMECIGNIAGIINGRSAEERKKDREDFEKRLLHSDKCKKENEDD